MGKSYRLRKVDPAGKRLRKGALRRHRPPTTPIEPLEPRRLLSILYVDPASPGPLHDGSSWPAAYPDLQPALLASKAGDTIRIATGTYKPTTDNNRAKSFQLKSGVSLLGGYPGFSSPTPDARNPELYPTTLSGEIGDPTTTADNSYHVLYAKNVDSTTLLDGLTITAGNANGSSGTPDRYGGGIYADSSSPTLTSCTFAGNSANYGGGIYNSNFSSPTLTTCTFTGNTGTNSGGEIYNFRSSSPTLTNCSFSGNSANRGGGMYNNSSSPTLTNCSFSGNSVREAGAGMYNCFSSPTLTNCIVWGNSSGTIYNESNSTPKVTFSDIQGSYPGTGNIDADPRFVRTPWAGPDGLFGTADDDPGDLRLRAGSPCIDTGNNSAIPTGLTTDLAGNPRIQNGTIDIGPYEGTTAAPTPKTLYVDAAAAGTNTGSSWANAFTSLQSALQAATDGDTIRLADGIYKASSSNDRAASFVLRNAVGIYGDYAGYGASDPDARDIVLYPTILSGDIGTPSDSSDNSYHVLTASGLGPSTVLDGLTVTGGNANGSGQSCGGGLYATGASPTLNNCSFSSNSATSGGGMANTSSSSPTLTNCSFSGNSATSGGGMYNYYSSSPTLTNCSFSGNSATSGGGMYNYYSSSPTLTNCSFSGNSASGYGGGMYNNSSSPTLTNCTFTSSSARDYGGGMYNNSSAPTLTNCTFSGNSGSSGGGMYSDSSSPTLSNCSFSGNSASGYGGGGGMYNYYASSPTLINCSFTGNSAAAVGGGMFNRDYSSPTLTNCTFSGNLASGYFGGGGMCNFYHSSPTLTNCTISGNLASGDLASGGMYNSSSWPTLTNCIVWGNSSAIEDDPKSTPHVTYSDIQGGYHGTGNLNADPQFIRDPSPGPDGKWATADDDYGDLRLSTGSPCINKGNKAALPSTLTTDLAGNPRICDGTVDLGAYESPSEDITLTGSPTDSFLLRLTDSTLEIFRNTNPDQAPPTQSLPFNTLTHLTLQGGHYTLASNLPGLNLSLENDTQVLLTTSQHLASLTLAPTATLDLADQALIVSATPDTQQALLSTLSALIRKARGSDATWTHPGLTSSVAHVTKHTTLALLLNNKNGQPLLTTFAGQSVGPNDILVKYTWNGDVNLDGVVDAADYFRIDSGFITQAPGYHNGDLNLDGQVDAADYFLVDSAFIAQSAPLATPSLRPAFPFSSSTLPLADNPETASPLSSPVHPSSFLVHHSPILAGPSRRVFGDRTLFRRDGVPGNGLPRSANVLF